MPRFFNPVRVPQPPSRYSQGAVHSSRARRLVISGQVGMRLDGSVPDSLAEQMEICWDNLLAVVAEAGMTAADILKVTVYVTEPGAVPPYRQIRDRKLGGHAAAATFLQVAGLASPAYKCEIEGEAVSEEPDMLFEQLPGAAEGSSAWMGKR